MTKAELIEFWYSAVGAEVGICIESTDVPSLKAKLYQVRRDEDDPSLESLALVDSPTTPNQLWIVKKDAPSSGE